LVDLYQMFGGKLVDGMPRIDYSNLTINHIQPPKSHRSITKLVGKRETAVEYAKWISKLVMENTKAGDKILIVTHKAMFDTHGLIPFAPIEPNKDFFPDRETHAIAWGQGIGSNHYNKCHEVFLFNEFFKPSYVPVGQVLGAKGIKAKDSDIQSQGGILTGEYKTVAVGDRLRWFKQLASRGTVRNTDHDGICGKMTLHTSMDWKNLIDNLSSLFPNAPIPNREFKHAERSNNTPKRRDALIEFLSTSELYQISFKKLSNLIGMKSFLIKRELLSQAVKPTFNNLNWKIVSAKEISESGKGLWLVKKSLATHMEKI